MVVRIALSACDLQRIDESPAGAIRHLDIRMQMQRKADKCKPLCACREEFMSAFGEQVELLTRQEALQKELETVGEDMEAMTRILDELDSLNTKVGGAKILMKLL